MSDCGAVEDVDISWIETTYKCITGLLYYNGVTCTHCFFVGHGGRNLKLDYFSERNVPRAAHEGLMTTATLQVRNENEGALGGPTFSPPLYRQRYAAALDLVREIQPKRVHLSSVGRDGLSMYAVRCRTAVQAFSSGWLYSR